MYIIYIIIILNNMSGNSEVRRFRWKCVEIFCIFGNAREKRTQKAGASLKRRYFSTILFI